VLWCGVVCCGVLRCAAVYCSVVQCVAMYSRLNSKALKNCQENLDASLFDGNQMIWVLTLNARKLTGRDTNR